MRLLFAVTIAALFVTIDSHAFPELAHSRRTPLTKEEMKQSEQFVLDLLKNFSSFFFQLITDYSGSSRVVSPLSVFIPMSMLAYGARRGTREDFFEAIGLPLNQTKMAKIGYQKILHQLAKYDVRIKTKIFVPPSLKLDSYYLTLSENVFISEIETLNVTDGFMDSRKINEWVAAQTNDDAATLFELQQIDRDPGIVVINTVDFKGTWEIAFNSSLTALRPFHPSRRNLLTVPTMHAVGLFRNGWLADLNAHFIELPYKSNNSDYAMSMLIFLPHSTKHDGTEKIIRQLKNINLERLLNSTKEKVEVYLPKFKIKTILSINECFDWMSQPIYPFNDAANFDGIFNSSGPSNFGESVTEVVMKIDENGHETSASSEISYNTNEFVTSDRKTRSIEQGVKEFKANRPFVAMIVTKGKIFTEIFSIHLTGSQFRTW